jgi:hypothetical protein
MSIWQELVEKHGFTARYAAVQRFVRGLHDVVSSEARVVIETQPGEEAQVDYGDGPSSAHGESRLHALCRQILAERARSSTISPPAYEPCARRELCAY